MALYTADCSAVGSFGYASYFKLYVELNETDVNVGNNTSKVNYNVYCRSSGSGSINANHSLYFNLNGSDIINSTQRVNVSSPNANIAIASGTTGDITHNSDGSKSISFSARIQASSYGVSASVSGTFILSTIPRASSVTCNDADIESSTTININRASSGFTHTITYKFGSLSGTIATKTSNTSLGWTIPSTFYAQIPNSKTGTGTITCVTYNGSTQIGSSSTTFTAKANESKCKPTLSATVVDNNATTKALTGDENKLIKYFSTALVTITATARNSSTIKTKKVNNTTVSGTTLSISKVETNSFVVTATDSRGYTTSITITKTMVNYIKLSANANFYRPSPTTGEVELTYSGNYFNGNFGSVNNALTVKWRYKSYGDINYGAWNSLTPTKSGNTYSNGSTPTSLGKTFDYRNTYTYQLYYEDKLSNGTITINVSQGIPTVNWGKDFFNVNGKIYKNGLEITQRHIMTAYLTTGTTLTTSGQYAKVPLDKYTSVGDRLTFNSSNDSIVIGKNVSKIRIEAILNHSGIGQNLNFALAIYKNGSIVSTTIDSFAGTENYYHQIVSKTPVLEVKEGDIFQLYARTIAIDVGDITVNGSTTGAATMMEIEVLE